MNVCKECRYYSGDKKKGVCFVLPPKINMAMVDAEWSEESLLNASVRPVVNAEDLSCTFYQISADSIGFIEESLERTGAFD
jgi:hypothetical protein